MFHSPRFVAVLLFVYVKFSFSQLVISFALFFVCFFFLPFLVSTQVSFHVFYLCIHVCTRVLIRRRNHYLFSTFGVRISGHKFPRMLQFYSLIMIIKVFASSEIKLNRFVI